MRRIHAPLNIRKKAFYIMLFMLAVLVYLFGRVLYIQAFRGPELQALAFEQQTRDRLIAPSRGTIYDRNMTGLAVNETVAGVSVLYAQMRDIPATARILAQELNLDEAEVMQKISRRVALVRVATQVDKQTADRLRDMQIPGVVIDEDIRRVYPFASLASQVIGFVGRDNQGIIGLEAKYNDKLQGSPGRILTETDVAGRVLTAGQVYRVAPTDGYSLVLTIDTMLQAFAEQTIELLVYEKNALRGVVILMNPQTGAIYALANKPDFDLNKPFTITDPALQEIWHTFNQETQLNYLNRMWRNFAINDCVIIGLS